MIRNTLHVMIDDVHKEVKFNSAIRFQEGDRIALEAIPLNDRTIEDTQQIQKYLNGRELEIKRTTFTYVGDDEIVCDLYTYNY